MTDENTELLSHHHPNNFLQPIPLRPGQSLDIGIHEYSPEIVQDVLDSGLRSMRFPPVPEGESPVCGVDRDLVPDPIPDRLKSRSSYRSSGLSRIFAEDQIYRCRGEAGTLGEVVLRDAFPVQELPDGGLDAFEGVGHSYGRFHEVL